MELEAGSKTKSGYLALPPSGCGPGVLVFPERGGLNAFYRTLCDRLAEEGFIALCPDVESEEEVVLALEALRNQPGLEGQKVGTLGCSEGASWAARLPIYRPEAVAAVVMFYGGDAAEPAPSCVAYSGHFPGADLPEAMARVEDLRGRLCRAGKDVRFFVYPGAEPGFFEEDRLDRFDADSAEVAWNRTVAFLRERL